MTRAEAVETTRLQSTRASRPYRLPLNRSDHGLESDPTVNKFWHLVPSRLLRGTRNRMITERGI
jgi:hypothetical protein